MKHNMKTHFYDIESLSNAFTNCIYRPEDNAVDVYILVDDPTLVDSPTLKEDLKRRIYEKNDNFRGEVYLYDLSSKQGNDHLAMRFGVSDAYLVNDPSQSSTFPKQFRPVCTTDPNFDEDVHPYLIGYNSYNYDTSMLAIYFCEVYPYTRLYDQMGMPRYDYNGRSIEERQFAPTTAKTMRIYNDELFTPHFKSKMTERLTVDFDHQTKQWSPPNYRNPLWAVRNSMMKSGRHVDIARINERLPFVGLEKILGTLGHQILGSDVVSQDNPYLEDKDQFYDLVAYNVSDVVNLYSLSKHRYYQGQIGLKSGLLKTYPELVYNKKKDAYAPDIKPEATRRDRLTIDSSSAQFATKALAPYGHLTDIPAVSFMYPSEKKAKEYGIERFNVLETTRDFFYEKFPQPELRQQFDYVYKFYKSIEGLNFNDSKTYKEDYQNTPHYQSAHVLREIQKLPNCIPYFNRDGSPSSCYVTFSTGGIHGSEYNKKLYDYDIRQWEKAQDLLDEVRTLYQTPLELRQAKTFTLSDGETYDYKTFLKSSATIKALTAATPDQYDSFYKPIVKPVLFREQTNGSTKLNPKYVYTSADLANHEDFVSYYPNMLKMLSAFWNDALGYDRYEEILNNKDEYDVHRKNPKYTKEERAAYNELREGTKLILNAASGAADTEWDSAISMNNLVISMRIIGQLFSWTIGQAQTYEGAKITSTNTDGLYSVMEATRNAEILAREAMAIRVEIEAEPLYLISKDANNRIEMNPDTGEVISTSGGVACYHDTDPTKSLTRPAIIDWALTEYLIVASLRDDMSLEEPFRDDVGLSILQSARDKFTDTPHLLRMFGNIISSSAGSMNYNFAVDPNKPDEPVILQNHNRVYILNDGTPNTYHIKAANARTITKSSINKRLRDKERTQQHDPFALNILTKYGVGPREIPSNREAIVRKVTNIEDTWHMYIQNRSLFHLNEEESNFILENLDYTKYLQLLKKDYTENWMNQTPPKTSDAA